MATATSYDQWEDTGLALDDEEIRGYEIKALASGRVNALIEQARIIQRAEQVGIQKPAFWKIVRARLLDAAGWYCFAMGVPAFDRNEVLELPESGSAEGKALTLSAQKLSSLTASDWVEQYSSEVMRLMQYAVTIGRRCSSNRALSGWGKAEKSLSNKLANSINKEMRFATKFRGTLDSMVD